MSPVLSVRTRLLAFCIGLIAVLGGSNFFLGYLIQQDKDYQAAQQLQAKRLEVIHATREAMNTYLNVMGAANAAALTKKQPWSLEARRAVGRARLTMDARLADLQTFEPEAVAHIRQAWDDLPKHVDAWLTTMIAGDQAGAQPRFEETKGRLDAIDATLNTTSERERNTQSEITQKEKERIASTIHRAGYVIGIASVVGLLLAWLVVKSIIRPLQITALAIRQVNAGETEIDLPPIREDEFGDMAVALRQFRDQAERLRRLAYRDSLTGLGNRASLEEELQRGIESSRKTGSGLALLYLDVDRFRAINDSLGYSAGDRYLCEVAARLSRFIPQGALLCRYSGDKFTILIEDLRKGSEAQTYLQEVAESILRGMAEPFPYAEHLLNMSVSIGIAVFPTDGDNAEQVLSSADAAVYLAKKGGRNSFQFAHSKLTGDMRRQLAVAGDIRRGIERDEFEPFYQPVVDVARGRVVGAEALLRWQHPERGLVLPGEFIATAEETGLISALGEQCLEKAHAQAVRWRAQHRNICVSVNLSVRQVQDGTILPRVRALHAAHGTGHIEFELTESALLDPTDQSRSAMNELKSLGYRIGLDDFGTGYSSLSYLQRLPIDKIKIDGSFVAKMETSRQAQAIISATLALARNLDLEVVAEGVETASQMHRLRDLGCALQQGFYFTPAMPSDDLTRWIEQYERAAAA